MTPIDTAARITVHALALCLSAAAARAQTCPLSDPCPGHSHTVVEMGSIGPLVPGAAFPDVQVRGFDEILGELRSVQLTVTLSSSGQRFAIENLDAVSACPGNPTPNAFVHFMDVSIDDPSAVSPLCENHSFAQFQGPIPALPANGEMPPQCDVSGPASYGVDATPQGQSCSTTCIEDHARLDFFKRANVPLGFVHFDVASAAPSMFTLGCSNVCASFLGKLTVSITATYTYCTEPGTTYCFGDNVDPVVTTDCPCANFGGAGRGCTSSNFALQGGRLTASGTVFPNTIHFVCDGVPNNTLCTFLRGTTNTAAGVVFGDGVECVSGTILRFGQQLAGHGGNPPSTASTGAATVAAGSTRFYQCEYRNANSVFCTPAQFNISSGYQLVW